MVSKPLSLVLFLLDNRDCTILDAYQSTNGFLWQAETTDQNTCYWDIFRVGYHGLEEGAGKSELIPLESEDIGRRYVTWGMFFSIIIIHNVTYDKSYLSEQATSYVSCDNTGWRKAFISHAVPWWHAGPLTPDFFTTKKWIKLDIDAVAACEDKGGGCQPSSSLKERNGGGGTLTPPTGASFAFPGTVTRCWSNSEATSDM